MLQKRDKGSYAYANIPNTGLGNKMLVWARAYIFSQLNNIPLITSSWNHIAWGAIYRNEKKRRWYSGYFKQANILSSLFLQKQIRNFMIMEEPPVEEIVIQPQTIYKFSKLFITDDFFYETRPFRDLLKPAIIDLLKPKLQNKFYLLESPFIGIHVRRGDFKLGSIMTSLSFFIDTITWIRSKTNFNCPVTVYSDASKKELLPLLELSDVHLAKQKEDILDILELSKSKILITSAGSTFSYWAAFFSDGIVLKPPVEWHVPFRPPENNLVTYEGIIDCANNSNQPQELIDQLISVCTH